MKPPYLYEPRSSDNIDPSISEKDWINEFKTFDRISAFLMFDLATWIRAKTDMQKHYLTKAEIIFVMEKLIQSIEEAF